jgi:hypothetical protein
VFISHIAYGVFVGNEAIFPLHAPFSFSEFIIPRSYHQPIGSTFDGNSIGLFFIYLEHTESPICHLSNPNE